MASETKTLKFVDDPSVRETYANKLISASFDGGAVIVTLGATRFVPENTAGGKEDNPPPIHVTTRFAVSPGGAVELANALGNMLRTLSEMQKKAEQQKAEQQEIERRKAAGAKSN
jgi:hypothetical protein